MGADARKPAVRKHEQTQALQAAEVGRSLLPPGSSEEHDVEHSEPIRRIASGRSTSASSLAAEPKKQSIARLSARRACVRRNARLSGFGSPSIDVQSPDDTHCRGRYDFVHVPMNHGSNLNMRYAFVNFYRPEDAAHCISSCTGRPFGDTMDETFVCNAEYARSQGTTASRHAAPRQQKLGFGGAGRW